MKFILQLVDWEMSGMNERWRCECAGSWSVRSYTFTPTCDDVDDGCVEERIYKCCSTSPVYIMLWPRTLLNLKSCECYTLSLAPAWPSYGRWATWLRKNNQMYHCELRSFQAKWWSISEKKNNFFADMVFIYSCLKVISLFPASPRPKCCSSFS